MPYDGSSPIFAYNILILQSDGAIFSEESIDCDGT